MMLYVIIFTFQVFLFSGMNLNSECQQAHAQFEHDVIVDSIMYYSFGLVPIEQNIKKDLRRCCNIYVKDIGCSPSTYESCYNKQTEQYFEKLTRQSFHKIF